MFQFLSSTPARVLTLVLLLQAAAYYGLARTEAVPQTRQLESFPKTLGKWNMQQEAVIEKEVLDVLKADDVLSRWYTDANKQNLTSLFVAYFGTQRTGKAPHSPRNCLPGSGWLPVVHDKIMIDLPGRPAIEANRYIVSKGSDKSLVVYWYQNHIRTVASEYQAKVYTVWDALRYNRSDVALVKVTIPTRGEDNEKITETAKDFVREFFAQLLPYFPR